MNEIQDFFDGKRETYPSQIINQIIKFEKGRAYYQFAMLVKNEKGTLHRILAVFDKLNVNLESLKSQYSGKSVVLSGLMSANEGEDISALEKGLMELDIISAFRTAMLHKNQYNVMEFPLNFVDDRAIVMTADIFSGFLEGLKQNLGSGGKFLIYNIGLTCGDRCGRERILKAFGGNDNVRTSDKLKFMKDLFFIYGLGLVEFNDMDIDARKGEIIVRSSVESECSVCTLSIENGCDFIRGMLTGYFKNVFGQESFMFDETMCKLRGDEYCKFVLR
ncbi:MAG TPA: hypothetical protein PK718_08325 [Candidatus Methanofastidiosa archaeon]|nr:hypothetical protein [Candidatus Methanofastidiosa archaeon]HPR42530.1 hypothetical protein [Candidatus Methanofastidiosa archaeon]